MAQIRTLKLNLLADVTKFGAGMIEARGDINKLSTTAERAGAKVKAAFIGMGIAAGYAAIRIGKESVQAALEDEASQAQLAKTLENVTGATKNQIAQTEKWISKQQFATGFTDSQLRPALANLVRVTDDVTEAQSLTNLAMDIARGTGKDLETVSLALAKAHEGNLGALTKLGVPLDEATKKTGDFEAAQRKLTELFGGQAANYADTYQGKLDIVNQRLGELKETAGVSLVGTLGNLLTVVNDVAMGFAGESGSLASSMSRVTKEGYYSPSGGENLGTAMKNVYESLKLLFDEVNGENGQNGRSALQLTADVLNKVAAAVDAVTNAIDRAKNSGNWSWDRLKVAAGMGGLGLGLKAFQGFANGGTMRAGQPYTVGEFGKEVVIPSTNSRVVPSSQLGGTTIINLNGIIDAESARRSIEKLLQDSARRTGAINLIGATL